MKSKEFLDGYIIFENGMVLNKKTNKKLKGSKTKDGYVTYFFNKKKTSYRAHRLVALNFIENPENKPEVNHIDGNKENNDVANLEWVTPSENVVHAVKEKLRKDMITVFQYSLNGEFIKKYDSIADASKETKISHSTITSNLNGKTKKALNFIFSKKEKEFEKYSNPKNKKVFKKDKDGNVLEIFESAQKAAESVGTDKRNFYLYIDNTKKREYKGFFWSYFK